MAAAIPFLTIASTAFTAVGAIQSANAQAAAYESQAAADDYNAEVADQNARIARQQAGAREDAQRRRARKILGQQRAAIAQSGTGLGGSNRALAEQSALEAELDALNIRYEGELQARGQKAQAGLDRYSARSSRSNASRAKQSGFMNAGAAVLGGVGDYYRSTKLKF